MSERTCGTCQHWLTIEDYQRGGEDIPVQPDLWVDRERGGAEPVRTDDYENVYAPGNWGYCEKVAEFGPRTASRFYVIDGSTYMAKLGTREDFGCVEHEPQEETA